jgi:F-type H+-transporting ATPase subunit a
MSNTRKIFLGVFGGYILLTVLAFLVFGSAGKNEEFRPQDEFNLDTWINLPGSLDINKAILYLFLAGVLTCVTMVYVARRMQQRPNRVQTAVETLYQLMRDNITRGNMDDKMAMKWFPFIGALFLFIWFSNLIGFIPLPTSHEKFSLFGLRIPTFGIYAATANVSVPLVLALIVFISYTTEGIRARGFIGYWKSLIPSGVTGAMARRHRRIPAPAGSDPLPLRGRPGGHSSGVHLRHSVRDLPRRRGRRVPLRSPSRARCDRDPELHLRRR